MKKKMKHWVRERMRLICCVAIGVLAGFGVGCGPTSEEGAAEVGVRKPYKAVATVGMIADILREVIGSEGEARGLIGEGVDPHLYKPTRTDVIALSEADIVFYNGLMLEGKMADVLVKVARDGKPVYAVTEAIMDGGDYVMNDADPHLPRSTLALPLQIQ